MPISRFITIVSGLPRSGTSLMMQMLEAGGITLLTDGVRVPDSDNPNGYYEYEPVKRTRHDSKWLRDAQGKAVKVIYALLRDLPAGFEYRVILMRRDAEEVLSSQAVMLRRLGTQGATIPPDRLATVFAADLADVLEALAKRPEFQVLEVGHGECLREPGAVAMRLSAFLGCELDTERLAAVPDEALYRRRNHHDRRT